MGVIVISSDKHCRVQGREEGSIQVLVVS